MSDQPQRVFVLSLVAAPEVDAIPALRALLKIALRRFKLRCISVEARSISVEEK